MMEPPSFPLRMYVPNLMTELPWAWQQVITMDIICADSLPPAGLRDILGDVVFVGI